MRKYIWTVVLAATVGCGGTKHKSDMPDAKSGTFDVTHELTVKIPSGAKQVRIWFTQPQENEISTIENFKVDTPVTHRVVKDSNDNAYLFFEIDNPDMDSIPIRQSFRITRREQKASVDPADTRPLTDAERDDMARYLGSYTHVVIDDRFQGLSDSIVGSEDNPIRASRRIYDWVLENIDYWVKDPKNKKASKVGSSEYCLTSKTGNCTDFHSLYLSLSRAARIPTRIIYGSLFKTVLDGKDSDASYHCWVEFWAPNVGWIPLDVAVADIFVGDFDVDSGNEMLVKKTTADGYSGRDPKKVEYYFGSLDERRVTWSVGRDLTLEPRQSGGPINAVPKAYVEIDGKSSSDYTRKLTFHEH